MPFNSDSLTNILVGDSSLVSQHAWSIILISGVSCQKGPTRHAYTWQIGPFWQDTLDMTLVTFAFSLNGNQDWNWAFALQHYCSCGIFGIYCLQITRQIVKGIFIWNYYNSVYCKQEVHRRMYPFQVKIIVISVTITCCIALGKLTHTIGKHTWLFYAHVCINTMMTVRLDLSNYMSSSTLINIGSGNGFAPNYIQWWHIISWKQRNQNASHLVQTSMFSPQGCYFQWISIRVFGINIKLYFWL